MASMTRNLIRGFKLHLRPRIAEETGGRWPANGKDGPARWIWLTVCRSTGYAIEGHGVVPHSRTQRPIFVGSSGAASGASQ